VLRQTNNKQLGVAKVRATDRHRRWFITYNITRFKSNIYRTLLKNAGLMRLYKTAMYTDRSGIRCVMVSGSLGRSAVRLKVQHTISVIGCNLLFIYATVLIKSDIGIRDTTCRAVSKHRLHGILHKYDFDIYDFLVYHNPIQYTPADSSVFSQWKTELICDFECVYLISFSVCSLHSISCRPICYKYFNTTEKQTHRVTDCYLS